MIFRNREAVAVEMLPGVIRRTLADGEKMMICEFTFAAGVEIPRHAHPHEQAGYLVSGRVRMTCGDDTFELGPGDAYRAPSNVLHGLVALEPGVIVDTFCPPREDYRRAAPK